MPSGIIINKPARRLDQQDVTPSFVFRQTRRIGHGGTPG